MFKGGPSAIAYALRGLSDPAIVPGKPPLESRLQKTKQRRAPRLKCVVNTLEELQQNLAFNRSTMVKALGMLAALASTVDCGLWAAGLLAVGCGLLGVGCGLWNVESGL